MKVNLKINYCLSLRCVSKDVLRENIKQALSLETVDAKIICRRIMEQKAE